MIDSIQDIENYHHATSLQSLTIIKKICFQSITWFEIQSDKLKAKRVCSIIVRCHSDGVHF